jgi:putative redox protein
VGHSLGGAAVLAAAHAIPEAAGIATIAAPFEPAHVLALIPGRGEIETRGEAEVVLAGRPFRITKQLLDDLAGQRPEAAVRSLERGLLVMHSPRDDTVPIDNATRIFQAARHPKSFVSLDPADHLLTRREDAAYAGHVIAAWAERFLGARGPEAPAAVAGKIVVRETREGKLAQLVAAGRHVLRADEPVAAGGLDAGPTPYDLLLAALGACTSMTVRLYADLKGLPLERVSVELTHDKIHAADCAECETREGKVDRIERVIRLEGALDDAQRAKLLEIAGKCPVHRTLHAEVTVPTRLE